MSGNYELRRARLEALQDAVAESQRQVDNEIFCIEEGVVTKKDGMLAVAAAIQVRDAIHRLITASTVPPEMTAGVKPEEPSATVGTPLGSSAALAIMEAMGKALEEIATSRYQAYTNGPFISDHDSGYKTVVADGHRFCAQVARNALAAYRAWRAGGDNA